MSKFLFLCAFTFLQFNWSYAQQDTLNNQKDADGLKQGMWLSYHVNGMVSRVENYKDDKLHGAVLVLSDRGFLEAEEHYLNGNYHGDQRYFRYGYLTKRVQYKNGEMDGVYEAFDRNNKIQERHFYESGKKHGLSTWYTETGDISFQYRYEHGEIEGDVLVFYKNGKLKSKTTYHKNEKDGVFEEYFENGTLKQAGQYKKGKEKGIWIVYNEEGAVILKEKK